MLNWKAQNCVRLTEAVSVFGVFGAVEKAQGVARRSDFGRQSGVHDCGPQHRMKTLDTRSFTRFCTQRRRSLAESFANRAENAKHFARVLISRLGAKNRWFPLERWGSTLIGSRSLTWPRWFELPDGRPRVIGGAHKPRLLPFEVWIAQNSQFTRLKRVFEYDLVLVN